MIDLTEAQIADAKANDIEAVTAVVTATEERVCQLARQYGTTGGHANDHLVEDLEQIGRIAVWEALSRFKGASVAEFFTFVDLTLKGVMSSARKVETRQGVSRAVAADFERAVALAGGDAYEAEWLVTTREAMGDRRMSPDMAYAARLSYQGSAYLDAPIEGPDGESVTLADNLVSRAGVPVDLLEPSDYAAAKRRATTVKVHDTLNRMGDQQRTVLMALTGVEPVGYYGAEYDDDLSADYGIPRQRVRVIRTKGKARFAELYEAA